MMGSLFIVVSGSEQKHFQAAAKTDQGSAQFV
jgi:hypothetical protein